MSPYLFNVARSVANHCGFFITRTGGIQKESSAENAGLPIVLKQGEYQGQTHQGQDPAAQLLRAPGVSGRAKSLTQDHHQGNAAEDKQEN